LIGIQLLFKEKKGDKKRAKKIGRNIKKNIAIEIPEHFIPAFKPAKIFIDDVKTKVKSLPDDNSEKEG